MIHVFGNAAIDTILHVDRFPRSGETIVARELAEDLGGKGANQAIVIARCGVPVRLAAALGDDAAGARIRQALEAEGVAAHGLAAFDGATDRCLILVDATAENMIVSLVDAARAFDPAEDARLAESIAPGDWVLMQGNLRPAVTRAVLALARRRGAATALNPSPTYPAAEYGSHGGPRGQELLLRQGVVRAVRHIGVRCWRRRWRARDGGQGCAAPAKPACAKRMSLTHVSSSSRKWRRQRTAVAQRRFDQARTRSLVQLRDPWSEPDCMTRSVSRAGSNSHTVAARNGRTPIPRAPRQRLRRTRPFWSSALKPNQTSVRSPGSTRTYGGPGFLRSGCGSSVRRLSSRRLRRRRRWRRISTAPQAAFAPKRRWSSSSCGRRRV